LCWYVRTESMVDSGVLETRAELFGSKIEFWLHLEYVVSVGINSDNKLPEIMQCNIVGYYGFQKNLTRTQTQSEART